MLDTLISIGDTLKEIRETKGFHLQEVAEKTTINYTSLSRIETGKRLPTKPQVQMLLLPECSYFLTKLAAHRFNIDLSNIGKYSIYFRVRWQKTALLVLRSVGLCVGQNQMCCLCGWLKEILKNAKGWLSLSFLSPVPIAKRGQLESLSAWSIWSVCQVHF